MSLNENPKEILNNENLNNNGKLNDGYLNKENLNDDNLNDDNDLNELSEAELSEQEDDEICKLKNKKLTELESELERQKNRADEYYNRLIRLQADFDNFRKRTQKEKEQFRDYGSQALITTLLPVLDNFQRALQTKTSSADGEKLMEGIKMIYTQLEELLQKEGLKHINALGEEFDPNKHEAVMQEETDEYPDGTVCEEMLRGYFFKDRLIRPAMVKVARS